MASFLDSGSQHFLANDGWAKIIVANLNQIEFSAEPHKVDDGFWWFDYQVGDETQTRYNEAVINRTIKYLEYKEFEKECINVLRDNSNVKQFVNIRAADLERVWGLQRNSERHVEEFKLKDWEGDYNFSVSNKALFLSKVLLLHELDTRVSLPSERNQLLSDLIETIQRKDDALAPMDVELYEILEARANVKTALDYASSSRQPSMSIESSHGTLVVDDKGFVLKEESDLSDYLENIYRIDIEEVENYIKNMGLEVDDVLDSAEDIMRFGFWDEAGTYNLPERQYRIDSFCSTEQSDEERNAAVYKSYEWIRKKRLFKEDSNFIDKEKVHARTVDVLEVFDKSKVVVLGYCGKADDRESYYGFAEEQTEEYLVKHSPLMGNPNVLVIETSDGEIIVNRTKTAKELLASNGMNISNDVSDRWDVGQVFECEVLFEGESEAQHVLMKYVDDRLEHKLDVIDDVEYFYYLEKGDDLKQLATEGNGRWRMLYMNPINNNEKELKQPSEINVVDITDTPNRNKLWGDIIKLQLEQGIDISQSLMSIQTNVADDKTLEEQIRVLQSSSKKSSSVREIDDLRFEVCEVISDLYRNNEDVFDKLDGQDGKASKADELVKRFREQYANVEWGKDGYGSLYDEVDKFVKADLLPSQEKPLVNIPSDVYRERTIKTIEEIQRLNIPKAKERGDSKTVKELEEHIEYLQKSVQAYDLKNSSTENIYESDYYKNVVQRELFSFKEFSEKAVREGERNFYDLRYKTQLPVYARALNITGDELNNHITVQFKQREELLDSVRHNYKHIDGGNAVLAFFDTKLCKDVLDSNSKTPGDDLDNAFRDYVDGITKTSTGEKYQSDSKKKSNNFSM